jgi:hypothetical protein
MANGFNERDEKEHALSELLSNARKLTVDKILTVNDAVKVHLALSGLNLDSPSSSAVS